MLKTRQWGQGIACLVVAEEPLRDALTLALASAGISVKVASTEGGALATLEKAPLAAVLLAHSLGSAVLASILTSAHRRHPEVPVVVLGATSTVDEAVDVMRLGAVDYLPPPIDSQLLLLRLRRIIEHHKDEKSKLPSVKASDFVGLVGASSAMMRVFGTVEKVSRYKTNVLLLGESGTGKELIARALHSHGPRRQHLFVPINCATLGKELLENELFGHERGAFTGANERKKGLFELADSGTLFFDEIGEMDPSTQAKLLRVLERNEFRRVGGTDKVKVDLSVIAATNRNLPDLIANGKFREDLYYRLKVVTVVVPPLRERKEDIPALIESFIADFNRRNNGKIKGISPQLLKRFMECDWTGNVREIKNAVESAAVLAMGDTIDADSVDNWTPTRTEVSPGVSAPARTGVSSDELRIPLTATLAEAERTLILAQLQRAKTKEDAAHALGIGLRTLYTKLREYEAQG